MRIEERFWTKVNIKDSDDCWEWLYSLSHRGYGRFELNGKVISAHRMAYILTNGPIPKGLYILHKCDNRKCVNPTHLYVGTQGDNITDREKRSPVDRALCGVTHAKFTLAQIQEIRKLRGTMSQRAVAYTYKVSHPTIGRIWRADKWLCKEGYYV
mgnify:CR=1 FL=1|jgi:hypothetical protein